MRKRILSVFMVLCLMMAIAPATFATGEETFDTWDGTTSTTPELVGGVYQIDSAADLVGFAAMVNSGDYSDADAVLMTGIDLNGGTFIPIGAYAYKDETDVIGDAFYSGDFDGNNHTIKNGTISNASNIYNMGIFGFVNGGSVSNLTAASITVNSTKNTNECSTGTIIGILYKGTATNLTASNGCVVTGTYRVGGVIGSVRDECTVDNCDNYATVTGSGMYCGGVIGASHDMDYFFIFVTGNPATIEDCDNHGTVNGNTEVGGIVGYSDQATITNCNNTGNVSATGNYGTGGIVGFDAYNPRGIYNPDSGSTLTGCSNSGNISGGRAGGIVGTLGATPGQSAPSSAKTLTRMISCSNTGNITGTSGKCGTIFGYQITYAHGDADEYVQTMLVSFENCTAGGTVNGSATAAFTESRFVAN